MTRPDTAVRGGDGAAPDAAPDARVLVGLMSGTSLDGISAAAVRFAPAAPLPDDAAGEAGTGVRHALLAHVQRPYARAQRERLLAAMERGSAAEYCRLAFDVGAWFADAAAAVIDAAGLAPADVAAVAMHGQTLWHEPPAGTWQLGEAAVVAERLGVPVIDGFRARDVAAGGQGAPLVPVADRLLYAAPDRWRLLQNLGGIGNVSVVAPGGARVVRAFDTGPGCAVIDGVVRRLTTTLAHDVDGRLAAAGTPVDGVVEALLAHAYFAAPPPKSTGRELFDAAYVERLIDAVRRVRPAARTEDVVATATALTARSIADQYRRFVPEPAGDVVLSGGGARNPALVRAITEAVAPLPVRPFDALFYDGEAKEAVAFALLGWLHLTGRPGNDPAATGARGVRRLGRLTPG